MLDMLTSLWPTFNPKAISLDFEKAAINAFSARFPDAEIHGCFSHLAQNMKRKVADLGLSARYRTDSDFCLQAKMIPALAFIPPERVEDAVRELRDELHDDLQPVLDYFEDSYIGRLRVRPDGSLSRRLPLFPVAAWTVYERTLRGESRTNNFAEAFHRSIQRQFNCKHPALLKFIDGIRTVQLTKDAELERYIAGQATASRKNEYVENDNRIMRVLGRLSTQSLARTLRGIAHTYQMNP